MKRIKEVMAISGLSRRTLQYYDDSGLMKVQRSPENYRLYSEADMERLWNILIYKEVGFSLDEIKQLLAEVSPEESEVINGKIRQIKDQIVLLERSLQQIEKLQKEGLPGCPTTKKATYAEQVKQIIAYPKKD